MRRIDSKLVIALAVFLTGAVVAWRALDRADRRVQSPAVEIPPFPYKSKDYETKPAMSARDELGRRLSDRIRTRISEQPEVRADMSSSRIDEFGKLASDRVLAILTPADDQQWRIIAERSGEMEARSLADVGESASVIAERHAQWPSVWREASISLDRVAVRRLDAETNRTTMPDGVRIGSSLRNLLGAYYPNTPDGAEIYEIIVPAILPATPGSRSNVPVYLGIAFTWDQRTQQWTGAHRQTTVYIPHGQPDVIPPP